MMLFRSTRTYVWCFKFCKILHSNNDYNLPDYLNRAVLLSLIDRMSLLKISLILLFQNSRSATVRVYFIIFILFKQNSSVIAALRLWLKLRSLWELFFALKNWPSSDDWLFLHRWLLHLHDNWMLHLVGSHHALRLLVRHRLQHERVGFLEAPALQDPRDGEERADEGKETSHG